MAPRNINTAPQYHWNNVPGARLGNQSVHLPNKYPAPSPDHHHGHPSYPYSHYRQPYVPYFYARSTYLVPGLLNSYWDSSYNSYADDESAYSSYPQQPAENNGGDYGSEPAPQYEPQQQMPDVPPPPPGPVEPFPQAAVTLVFKDGHSQEIHNYAMTKTTLYVLDEAASGRRPEIALEQIDVPATERANQGTGVHFAVPTRVD